MWLFHSGLTNPDSDAQLNEARSGYFSDWHPPAMSLLWRQLDAVFPGAFGMLLLQIGMFWFGIFAIVVSFGANYRSIHLLCLVGILPPVLSFLGVVVKDVQFGTTLLMSFALICVAYSYRCRFPLFASLIFMNYGILLRYNSVAAVFPLAVLWIWTFRSINCAAPATPTLRQCFMPAVLMIVLMGVGGFVLIQRLAHPRQLFVEQTLFLFDLVGMQVQNPLSNIEIRSEFHAEAFSEDNLRRNYRSTSACPLVMEVCSKEAPPLRLSTSEAAVLGLRHDWLKAALQSPFSYLRHRLQVFLSLLSVDRVIVSTYSLPETSLRTEVINRLMSPQLLVLFEGFIWLTLCALLTVLNIHQFLRGEESRASPRKRATSSSPR